MVSSKFPKQKCIYVTSEKLILNMKNCTVYGIELKIRFFLQRIVKNGFNFVRIKSEETIDVKSYSSNPFPTLEQTFGSYYGVKDEQIQNL